MKKKNLKLDVKHDIDFGLIGISSHENDYRLVWAVNNAMKFSFVRINNLKIRLPKHDETVEFSKFVYEDEERYMVYCLIANRCANGILFPEIKNLDYLLQINGKSSQHEMEELLLKLRKIDIISAAYILEPLSMKGITRIIHF